MSRRRSLLMALSSVLARRALLCRSAMFMKRPFPSAPSNSEPLRPTFAPQHRRLSFVFNHMEECTALSTRGCPVVERMFPVPRKHRSTG
ncbi:hypothetical protein DS837_24145 [Azospirillum brasilense]|uniref:Secreted protein n=1 Tax=Azospirillum brasilense TaxID=192 RepID=A0A6L3AXT2_AZOBR|nr:hypothetical protein DS837_24145 [Azospirillum brasilense]